MQKCEQTGQLLKTSWCAAAQKSTQWARAIASCLHKGQLLA